MARFAGSPSRTSSVKTHAPSLKTKAQADTPAEAAAGAKEEGDVTEMTTPTNSINVPMERKPMRHPYSCTI